MTASKAISVVKIFNIFKLAVTELVNAFLFSAILGKAPPGGVQRRVQLPRPCR